MKVSNILEHEWILVCKGGVGILQMDMSSADGIPQMDILLGFVKKKQ